MNSLTLFLLILLVENLNFMYFFNCLTIGWTENRNCFFKLSDLPDQRINKFFNADLGHQKAIISRRTSFTWTTYLFSLRMKIMEFRYPFAEILHLINQVFNEFLGTNIWKLDFAIFLKALKARTSDLFSCHSIFRETINVNIIRIRTSALQSYHFICISWFNDTWLMRILSFLFLFKNWSLIFLRIRIVRQYLVLITLFLDSWIFAVLWVHIKRVSVMINGTNFVVNWWFFHELRAALT